MMNRQGSTDELSVLYLEDEALIAMDIADLMAERGVCDVTVCHRARDALAGLESGDFSVALLDVNLGGGETSHEVAASCVARGVPVVFCTGYNHSEEITAEFDAPVIQKPVDPDALVATLRRVARQRQPSA